MNDRDLPAGWFPMQQLERSGGTKTRLVIARHVLDEQLDQALQARGASSALPWLAWAPLALQPTRQGLQALAGELRAGAPHRLPVMHTSQDDPTHPPDTSPPPSGLLLLYLAAANESPPDQVDGKLRRDLTTEALWEAWLVGQAPDYRLACTTLVPTVAVLWLCADGRLAAMLRKGDDDSIHAAGLVLPDARYRLTRWRPVDEVSLPGAQMLHMAAAAPVLDVDAREDLDGRYSRQAAALGPQVLQRLQSCMVAVVGAGRIGSVLAHSLVRMGCSVLVIDPDDISAHSLDGDLPPFMEGRPKVEGLMRQLRGLSRPGASIDVRRLSIASPVAGSLLADCDIVCCCVDNDAARLWANAWALALLKPLLVVAVDVPEPGAEAELRLLPPGCGCQACVGGFAQAGRLVEQLTLSGPPATPADFRLQRRGSLRSWGALAAHAGLRMVEQMVDGRLRGARFRRLVETDDGGLRVSEAAPDGRQRLSCPCCAELAGGGVRAVQLDRLARLALHLQQEAASAGLPIAAPLVEGDG